VRTSIEKQVAPPALLVVLAQTGDPVDAALEGSDRPQPAREATAEHGGHVLSQEPGRTRQRDEGDHDGDGVQDHDERSVVARSSTTTERPRRPPVVKGPLRLWRLACAE
jgi:hypothetical protein